jgi:hypothetical protein
MPTVLSNFIAMDYSTNSGLTSLSFHGSESDQIMLDAHEIAVEPVRGVEYQGERPLLRIIVTAPDGSESELNATSEQTSETEMIGAPPTRSTLAAPSQNSQLHIQQLCEALSNATDWDNVPLRNLFTPGVGVADIQGASNLMQITHTSAESSNIHSGPPLILSQKEPAAQPTTNSPQDHGFPTEDEISAAYTLIQLSRSGGQASSHPLPTLATIPETTELPHRPQDRTNQYAPRESIPGFPRYDEPLPKCLSDEDTIEHFPNHLHGETLRGLLNRGWTISGIAKRSGGDGKLHYHNIWYRKRVAFGEVQLSRPQKAAKAESDEEVAQKP